MKVSERLTQDTWIQGNLALDRDGCVVHPCSPAACQWCLVGAILACYPSREEQEAIESCVYDALCPIEWPFGTIATWNDASARTFADVIALARRLDI